jgi:hypothetical protein
MSELAKTGNLTQVHSLLLLLVTNTSYPPDLQASVRHGQIKSTNLTVTFGMKNKYSYPKIAMVRATQGFGSALTRNIHLLDAI